MPADGPARLLAWKRHLLYFCSKANLLEADVWKEFLARPSLPYVLRLLTGLCKGHETTQVRQLQTIQIFISLSSYFLHLVQSSVSWYCVGVTIAHALLHDYRFTLAFNAPFDYVVMGTCEPGLTQRSVIQHQLSCFAEREVPNSLFIW